MTQNKDLLRRIGRPVLFFYPKTVGRRGSDGWKTEDMLSGIEGVMNLAAASSEDLATTSDIVTYALTAFGLTAKDSGISR